MSEEEFQAEKTNVDEEIVGALEGAGNQLSDELLELEGFLKGSHLFSSLDPEGRRALAATAQYRWTVKGETIVEEGDTGDGFFLIKSGEVGVKTEHEGKPVPLARLGAGDFFGEVGFLTGRPRTATCVVLADAELFEFHRSTIDPILAKYPDTIAKLRQTISARSEDTIRKLYS